MTVRIGLLAAVMALAAGGSAIAAAREPFEDHFFVRRGATGRDMLADRSDCVKEVLALGSGASSYTNPQYGALAAMGAALDTGELHGNGLRQRMQLAVLNSCMERKGWTSRELGPGDRAVARANERHPEALDAWLKANEPAAAPPPPAPPATQPKTSPAPAEPAKTPPPTVPK